MTYSLEFDRRALKEWNKLGDTLRQQFKRKLAEIIENPRIESNRIDFANYLTATNLNCAAPVID